jgi:hypothetical protein
MKSTTAWILPIVVIVALVSFAGGADVAAPPAPPKISTFAPAGDLASQVKAYIDDLEQAVATEKDYKDNEGKVAKQSNTLILLALALGLHDSDNAYQAAAPALFKAAQKLAAAKDYASARAGVAAVKAAAEAQPAAEPALKWEKIASLEQLMKQVPLVNTKMKRHLKGSRFAKSAKETAGYSAVLAVIAQGAMADTSKAKGEDQVKQWYKFSGDMRDAAGAVNAGIHAQDQAATTKAMAKLAQSCDDCHEVFNKDALKATKGE